MLPQAIKKELGKVKGLGRPRAYFPVRKNYRTSSAWGAAALFVLGALSAAVVLSAHLMGWQLPDVQGAGDLGDALTVLAVFALGYSLYSAWTLYRNWDKAVIIYEGGLAYYDNKGLSFWRWDETAELRSKTSSAGVQGVRRKVPLYILVLKDGRKIRLDETLADLDKLAQILRRYAPTTRKGEGEDMPSPL